MRWADSQGSWRGNWGYLFTIQGMGGRGPAAALSAFHKGEAQSCSKTL